jgi:hypothetical protein
MGGLSDKEHLSGVGRQKKKKKRFDEVDSPLFSHSLFI